MLKSKNLPMTTPCDYCKGVGSHVIKNVYDKDYKEIEPCVVCGGTGFVHFNPNQDDKN